MDQKLYQICHIQLLPLMSGVQRSMLEIFSRLDGNIYRPVVICQKSGPLTRELERRGIAAICISFLQRSINPIKDLLSLLAFMKIFKKYHFDIIHTHSSKTGFLGRLAANWAGIRYIFHTVHGLPFHEFSSFLAKRFFILAEKLVCRYSTKVIFVNHEERKLAIELGIVPAEKAVTIYNGVDLEKVKRFNSPQKRRQLRQQWHIGAHEFVVGYVGRLWRQKDPQTLIKIIQLCADLPVKFLIVGDGPYLSRLQQMARDNPQILLTGWVEEPFFIYPAIDVLLLPSLWEGLSITLLEAMAFGKPLIASNIKGNRECVWHGRNGFLCEPKNPEAFKMAIRTLLEDKRLRQKMGKNSRRLCEQYFDANINARAVIRLYEEAVGELA